MKKIISLLLVLVMVMGFSTVVFAADEVMQPANDEVYKTIPGVSGTEAMSRIGDDNVIFLDLRAAVDFAAGHIKDTTSAPVCLPGPGYDVTLANQEAFVAQMKDLKVAENNTTIYLSCYAGTFCVNYAMTWLTELCGVDKAQLYCVEGGTFAVNGDYSLANAAIYTDPAYALEADGTIIDVRNTDVYYADGYVDGSIHLPLFSASGINVDDYTDDLSKAFLAYAKKYKAELEAKPIYILCNSGSKGAQKATALLKQAELTNVYTIEGGAGALKTMGGILVKQNFDDSDAIPDALDVLGKDGYVFVNVRLADRYAEGHLKGSINIPVFYPVDGKPNGAASNGYDSTADAFLAGVKANASKLDGKKIYVVCNGGASGAKAATKLLMKAGYSNEDIITVTGGYGNADIKAASTYVTSAKALSVLGNDDYVVIDVRAAEKYNADRLEGSISLPLFTIGADGGNVPVANPNDDIADAYDDDLSKAFLAYVEANKEALSGKTIYVLCNSGATGAANARILLEKAGIVGNVFTIEGGYNLNQDIQDAAQPVENDNEDSKEEDNKQEDSKEEEKAPATGDNSLTMVYVVAMLAAASVVIFNRKKVFR